jgi:hypothetical protein
VLDARRFPETPYKPGMGFFSLVCASQSADWRLVRLFLGVPSLPLKGDHDEIKSKCEFKETEKMVSSTPAATRSNARVQLGNL